MKTSCLRAIMGIGLLATGGHASDLHLALSTPKDKLVFGEALTLQLVVSNSAAIPFEQRQDSVRINGTTDLWVSADGQQFRKVEFNGYIVGTNVQEMPVGVPYPPPVFKLASGAAQQMSFPVLFSMKDLFGAEFPLRHYVFSRAGTYHLRCEMNGERSNSIQVTVEEPKDEDLTVWRKLQAIAIYPALLRRPEAYNVDDDTIRAFQGMARNGENLLPEVQAYLGCPAAVDQLATVVDQHPNSLYAHRLAFALGLHYSGPRGDLTNDERLRRAKKYLRVATQLQQAPELREPAWWEWIQVETDDQARAVLCRQALQAFPNGALRERFVDAFGLAASNLADGNARLVAQVEQPTIAECRQKQLSNEQCSNLMLQRKVAWLRQNFNPLDATPPVLTLLGVNPVILECGGVYADAGATATDNKDGDITARIQVENNVDTPKVGTYQVIYRVTDAAGNAATATRTVKVVYRFDGFLAPIGGADATGGSFEKPVRAFKLGSTVPVKFKIGCGGAPVTSGTHTLQVIKQNNATTAAEPIDATPADAATSGSQFKLTGDEWHFNLDTKATAMSTGTWQLKATLADGSTHTVWIELK